MKYFETGLKIKKSIFLIWSRESFQGRRFYDEMFQSCQGSSLLLIGKGGEQGGNLGALWTKKNFLMKEGRERGKVEEREGG